MVYRLHMELDHADPRRTIDSHPRKHAHRLIIATAKRFSCNAREESLKRRLHPVAARVLHVSGTYLLVDQFERKHCAVPARGRNNKETWTRNRDGEIYVEYTTEPLDQVPWQTKHYQNGSSRSLLRSEFRHGLAAKSIRLDIDAGDSSWKTTVLGETPDTIKEAAIRVALRNPDSVTIQEIFGQRTTARNDVQRNRGSSPWQLLLRKTPSDESI